MPGDGGVPQPLRRSPEEGGPQATLPSSPEPLGLPNALVDRRTGDLERAEHDSKTAHVGEECAASRCDREATVWTYSPILDALAPTCLPHALDVTVGATRLKSKVTTQ